uniref:hypothetical protein n=1 Tax=Psychrobacter sp. TaxID=56811 RepID=UPI0015EF6891|nr:hypothetical protein [Psychrobacter sp.]
MNTSSMISDEQGKEPYSFNKHYVFSNVKYYDYQKYDNQGNILPVPASGASGRFEWDKNCLVFITVDGSRATPILPFGVTQWDSASKTLHIDGTTIRMGDLIEANGTFTSNLSNREGICWNYPYIVGIGVMGGITVLED